jgi:hypothetical protein
VKYDFLVHMDYAKMLVAQRPEVHYAKELSEMNPWMSEGGVAEIYAPGDALVWSVAYVEKQLAKCGAILGKEPHREYQQSQLRRDFPREGELVSITAPSTTDGFVKPQYIPLKTHIIHMVDCGEGVTRMFYYATMQRGAEWSLPHMPLQQSIDSARKMYAQVELALFFKQSFEGDRIYTTVTLRTTKGGPPLLPKPGTDKLQWEAFGWSSLQSYLTAFLQRLGADHLAQHLCNTLDHRPLRPYQVVVRADHWEQIWAVLREPWVKHRAAYRAHTGGGSHTPTLKVGNAPKWDTVMSGGVSDGEGRRATPCIAPWNQRIQVRNTFLEVGSTGVLVAALRRSRSVERL